jgi:NAD(P)-dependent dehydrogenase (short-subunit alcohol dehydrogenase family)
VSDSLPLEGRVAFLAGAGGRFGRPIAVAFAEAGAAIALASTSRATAEGFAIASIANELWALGSRHLSLTMDVAEPESVMAGLHEAQVELGRIDLLINAADSPAGSDLEFLATADADWQRIVQSRLGGAYLTCHAAGRIMLEQGHGGILNLVSPAAHGRAGPAALAAAESGVLGLSRSLAAEWLGRVCVNVAAVGAEALPSAVAALCTLLAAENAGGLSGQVFEL